MKTANSSSRAYRSFRRRAFTLVELMVIVTILAILISLLIPNMQTAVEQARISNCTSVLHNIGSAQAQYVADNHGNMQPYVTFEPHPDYRPDWQVGYCIDYHNTLGMYLGLGDCMPRRGANYDAASRASYSGAAFDWGRNVWMDRSRYAAFQCPSGVGKEIICPAWWSPQAGWQPVGSFYMQNCWWTSQQPTRDWPNFGPYFPKFTNPSRAVLLFEHWAICMTSNSDAVSVPYDTHYRSSTKGPLGIGRNHLFADWHVSLHKCVDGPDTNTGGGWYCGSTFIPSTHLQRGNEGGEVCVRNGVQFVGWYGTLEQENE